MEKRNWKVHECYIRVHEGYILIYEGSIPVHEGFISVHEGFIPVHEGYILIYEVYVQENKVILVTTNFCPQCLREASLGPMQFFYRYFWPSVAKALYKQMYMSLISPICLQ